MAANDYNLNLGIPKLDSLSDCAAIEYALLSVEQSVEKLASNMTSGLSSIQEISYRKQMYGLNELEEEDDEPLYIKFIKTFYEDPLILLLIGSAAISFFMGNIDDAVSITVAILIVVTVGFVQEYRLEKSLEALNRLVPPNAHLTRYGKTDMVLANELVPGDIVHFNVGDRIPADVRLVKSVDLSIDESNLTGETNPVAKNAQTIIRNNYARIQLADATNIAFMGTMVRDGNGVGIVVCTGSQTAFGKIFKMMSDIEKPKTPLQIKMNNLGKQLSLISFGIIGVICLIGILEGKSWLDMFQISVSLAVAAIPEGLPIIVTVTLALGVLRMASYKAIVRRLPSVETLGSVNVLCTDKTGTLTKNYMTVSQLWTPEIGEPIVIPNDHNRNQIYSKSEASLLNLLEIGNFCNNSKFSVDANKYIGNPTDIALVDVLTLFKLNDIRDSQPRIQELSFNSTRKYMAVVVDSKEKSENVIYVKGAYEKLLNRCSTYGHSSDNSLPLTDSIKEQVIEVAESMASKGLRILALARKESEPSAPTDLEKLAELRFSGLIGIYDPPRESVPRAISEFLKGGIRIIMITGDSESTALSIGRQIGLLISNPEYQVVSGTKLDSMSDMELSNAISNIVIFARSTPSHKVRIVKALQQRGNVVAMTGDGVNDAPALKLADIGISMGINGTDVAKEASDMILVNDDFTTILTAVEEGKGIFYNIQNFLCFQLSTSIGALGLITLTTLMNLPSPLNPMMILFINIIMDGPPAQSLGMEKVDDDIMSHPPRSKNENILSSRLLKRIALKGLVTVLGTYYMYLKEISMDQTITKRDTTMTFVTFVMFDMWNAISSKHNYKSIFAVGFFTNRVFNFAIGIIIAAQLGIVYVPLLQNIFQTEALNFSDWLFVSVLSSSVFFADEIYKHYCPEDDRFGFSQASYIV